MKKCFLIALFALLLLPIVSCKKGSEDPTISFRSRNNRLEGTWNIVECNFNRNIISISNATDTSYTRSSFKNDSGNTVRRYNGIIEKLNNYVGTASLEFTKDGFILYKEQHNASGGNLESTSDGIWNWRKTGKSKYSISIGTGSGTPLGFIFKGGEFTVTKLSHKEIILESSFSESTKITGTGETSIQSNVTYCKLERTN